MTGMYCEHERTADACEDCAYAAAKAAGRPVADALQPEQPKAPEVAPRKRSRPVTHRPE